MAKNNANIRIYGGAASAVWMAPKGTTAPTGIAAPATPWVELGWISDGGLDFDQKADKKKFYAWQGGSVVKISVSKAERTFQFECLEETAVTLGLAYPDLAFTVAAPVAPATTGVASGTVGSGIRAVEKAFLFDAYDSEGNLKRYVVPDGYIDPSNKTMHKFDALTVYSFSVDVVGGFDIRTNSPGVVAP